MTDGGALVSEKLSCASKHHDRSITMIEITIQIVIYFEKAIEQA